MLNRKSFVLPCLWLAACASSPAVPDEASKQTLAEIRSFANAVESYATDRREFPRATTIDQLRALLEPKYIVVDSEVVTDGWGRPLRYVSTDGCHYSIASDGPDGTEATPDDIRYVDNSFVSVPRGAESLYEVHEPRGFACTK